MNTVTTGDEGRWHTPLSPALSRQRQWISRLRPACSTNQVPGQSRLYRETLSQKNPADKVKGTTIAEFRKVAGVRVGVLFSYCCDNTPCRRVGAHHHHGGQGAWQQARRRGATAVARAHILIPKQKADRANWKWQSLRKPPSPSSRATLSPARSYLLILPNSHQLGTKILTCLRFMGTPHSNHHSKQTESSVISIPATVN